METCAFSLLKRLFDTPNLLAFFKDLPEQAWLPHVNQKDYQGDWDVLPLRCASEHSDAHPILQAFSISHGEQWHDLPVLANNILWQILTDYLQCPIKSARLMRLDAGACIKPHVDDGLSLESGEVRLHLPLQTDDALHFFVDDKRVPMQVGELWYINAEKCHWVENKGQQARVNLVIDCEVNDWLREQIGKPESQLSLSNQYLHQFALNLLESQNAGEAKDLIDPLLERLCETVDLELHPDGFRDEDASETCFGKAVSLTTAAQCAEDPERGRVFIQGLYQAIHDQLTIKPSEPVQVLYAGTGPFAWLILPLLTLFTPKQLQVTLLDIHQESLDKLSLLFDLFGFHGHVAEWVCADATSWQPKEPQVFDLIVSETMKHLLQQEPQVQVFTHLQQFLAASGQLIPNDIVLDAWLEVSEPTESMHCRYLGPLFSLNRKTAKQLFEGDRSLLCGRLQLPEFEPSLMRLKLTTKIQVYKNHWLGESQSQLTLPRYKTAWLTSNSEVGFQYVQGAFPDFVFDFPECEFDVADSDNLSCCGIYHLRRLWDKTQQTKWRKSEPRFASEWLLDNAVLDCCGIGLEPGIQALYHSKTFNEFSAFIEQEITASSVEIDDINAKLKAFDSNEVRDESKHGLPLSSGDDFLSNEQRRFWEENGYVIIPRVLSAEQCAASRALIWGELGADENNVSTWYHSHNKMQKIMLQLFRHPVLDANRCSPKISRAFEALWGRKDLVMTTDRVGFNPPETDTWRFPGPDLHWDLDLSKPISFATQGLIYLTDTDEQQGAFSCVPGFHLQIDSWLKEQTGEDLQRQDWSQWPVKKIAAKAGDLIIWHHALPHGASANKMKYPRMVQYINCYPVK